MHSQLILTVSAEKVEWLGLSNAFECLDNGTHSGMGEELFVDLQEFINALLREWGEESPA